MPMKTPTRSDRSPLDAVPDDVAFRFRDGAVARSLPELRDALARMRPDDATYHREHLVPWVRDVLRDEPLARRLAAYAASGAEPDVYRETVADLVARRVEQLSAPDAR